MASYKKSGYHIIYKATSPSGKSYVGYTHYTLDTRISLHFQEANKGTKRPFCYALKKYGKSIKWEILATYQTEKFGKNQEKYFIKKLNTMDKTVGYNCTKGGEGTPGLVRTSQRKAVIDNNGIIYSSAVDISKKLNIECSTIRNSIKHNYWCFGHYFSYYKEGMTVAIQPKTLPKGRRRIKNITTGEEFNSIKEAVEKYGISEQRIGRVCRGERNKVHGFKFSYMDEV